MNLKTLFAGGLPGETYTQGVRRRGRSIGIIWAFVLVSLAVTYGVFSLSGSVWAAVGVAMLCGIASSRADVGLDPPKGDAPNKSDKLIWLILFVPALALLGAASVYSALHAHDGFGVFKAGLLAGLFGWMLGFTLIILMSADSRVRA